MTRDEFKSLMRLARWPKSKRFAYLREWDSLMAYYPDEVKWLISDVEDDLPADFVEQADE